MHRGQRGVLSHPYFVAAMMALAIALGSWVIHRPESSTTVRVTAAVAPLPFAVAVFRALMRYVRGLDELEQRKQLEAIAWALGVTTITVLLVGLLQAARVLPSWGWHGVWIIIIPAYFAGVILAGRRYR